MATPWNRLKGELDPGDIFKKRGNSADAAMPYLDQAAQLEGNAYNPYIQHGQDAYNAMNPVLQGRASDPAAYLEKLMAGYTPSKGFNYQQQQALQGASNDAAAGGRRGGSLDVQNQSNISNSLLSGDMQNWLKNAYGVQNAGLDNLQKTYATGYQGSSNLAGDLSNIYGTQEGLKFQGDRDKRQSSIDRFSGLTGAVGGVVGGIYGGPGGAMAGYNAGSGIGSGIGGMFY